MKKSNIGIILILAVILSFICGSLGAYVIVINTEVGGNIIKNITKSDYVETSLADAVENIYDAVVVVEGYQNGNLISTGTGFVYKKQKDKAYIMTNHHVVNGSDSIKLILSDNSEIDAKVQGTETYSDIAVLVTDAKKVLAVAELGNNEEMNAGDTVFTVGSPEGAEYFGTVTKGVLSSKDRLVAVSYSNTVSDYYMKVMQTDAAINPGNSGGPICNISGQVIGVTNMKLVDSSVEGMGFAIPIEDALYYAETLEKGEELKRPFVGISMLDMTDEFTLWQHRIQLPEKVTEGVVVLEVQENSPASKGKLQKGDVIIELENEKVSSIAEFRYVLYKHEPGEKIEVKYVRNNKVKTTKITLEENEQ